MPSIQLPNGLVVETEDAAGLEDGAPSEVAMGVGGASAESDHDAGGEAPGPMRRKGSAWTEATRLKGKATKALTRARKATEAAARFTESLGASASHRVSDLFSITRAPRRGDHSKAEAVVIDTGAETGGLAVKSKGREHATDLGMEAACTALHQFLDGQKTCSSLLHSTTRMPGCKGLIMRVALMPLATGNGNEEQNEAAMSTSRF